MKRRVFRGVVVFFSFLLLGICSLPYSALAGSCAPEIRSFEVGPRNACVQDPGRIGVTWKTTGSRVTIEVVSRDGDRLVSSVSGLDPEAEYLLPEGKLPKDPGEYLIRLTAEKEGCGESVSDTRPLHLVGKEGVWVDYRHDGRCDAGQSECRYLPSFKTTVEDSLVGTNMLLSEIRLDGASCKGGACKGVELGTFQVCRQWHCLIFCGVKGCAFELPRPVPATWDGPPYGSYKVFMSVKGANLSKGDTLSVDYSFKFVCKQ